MKKKGFIILLSIAFVDIFAQSLEAADLASYKPLQVGKTSGGDNIITYTKVATEFRGWAISPDKNIIKYEWDFDGDGQIDFASGITGTATHTFTTPGRYIATFKAHCDYEAELPSSEVRVVVRDGFGKAEYIPRKYSYLSGSAEQQRVKALFIESLNIQPDEQQFLQISDGIEPGLEYDLEEEVTGTGDGIKKIYILMINGGSESRYWDDVNYAYEVFTIDYNIPDDDIYLLNWDGVNPDGNNPGNMIDNSATIENVQSTCLHLSSVVDGDDLLYVFATGHGRGYTGPNQYTSSQQGVYGYMDGSASVDPGDEEDYLESEFKLRALHTGGTYICNHGMNEWKVSYAYAGATTYFYRHQYVSHFSDVNFVEQGIVSDSDIYIEEFKDYLEGDLNKDGKITEGEVIDFDGDGNSPYEHSTGIFDEDDWGDLDELIDDVKNVNTRVPDGFQSTYAILDYGLDNYADIDLDHDPANPEINGTDLDNSGLFDGLDINDDKDMNDWVSIDEKICMYYYSDDMPDDQLTSFLETINAQVIVVSMLPCFSGGFIEDLMRDNRVIMTSCEEETTSYGNLFMRNILSALSGWSYPGSSGNPDAADTNGDGFIDMVEVFNYAGDNDYSGPIQMPQYNDDCSGISSAYPIPLAPLRYGEQGWLGNRVTLLGWDIWLGDFDADRDVDTEDIARMCDEWLAAGSYVSDIGPEPEGDEFVNILDFCVLAKDWLKGI